VSSAGCVVVFVAVVVAVVSVLVDGFVLSLLLRLFFLSLVDLCGRHLGPNAFERNHDAILFPLIFTTCLFRTLDAHAVSQVMLRCFTIRAFSSFGAGLDPGILALTLA
ncbi:unnamed protein product, partial [Polarella glacialis]